MIQSIIDGIVAAIRTEYDKSFKIYTESVEQGLQEPCFSVLCLNGSNEQHVGARHNRAHLFNIAYFPSSEEPILECLNVMDNLYGLLGLIRLIRANSVRVRGTNMSGSVVDGVLQFQVTYETFLLETVAGTNMEELEVKTDGKE